MTKRTLQWYFPPTGGGVAYGFNDGGQEHFRANAWGHTIREIIQNSLDAADPRRNGPVIVKISEMIIPASEIGSRILKGHIKKALERTDEQRNNEGIKFYKHALKILNQNKISVLAITDTNTTGLTDEKWNALIYDEGTPSKDNMIAAGGSFGIGKNAPYLVSALRTMCYSTRYLGKGGRQEKFIARCKISAHLDPRSPFDELQHIGFGTKSQKIKENSRPSPTEGNNIYNVFRLDNSGSGIFIMGFDPRVKNWIEMAKESIVDNFFVAIHEKKLEIFINSESINHETIDNIFENNKKKEIATRHFYHIIRDNIKKYPIENKFGKFIVQVSANDEDLPNKIAYVNRRGMMITDQRTFKKNPFHTSFGRGWAKYAVVIMAQDDVTDSEIRKMEPPNHQSIEYERVNEPKARKVIKEQLKEIRNKVEDIIKKIVSDSNSEYDVYLSELADLLPIHDNHSGKDGHESETEIDYNLKHHPIIQKPSNPTERGTDLPDLPPDSPNNGGNKKKHASKKHTMYGKDTSILRRLRIVRNKNKLCVAFTPQQNDGEQIRFAIVPAGEEKRNEFRIPITSAQVTSLPNCNVRIDDNCIAMTPKHDKRVVIDLEIQQDQSYTGYEIVELISSKKHTGGKK